MKNNLIYKLFLILAVASVLFIFVGCQTQVDPPAATQDATAEQVQADDTTQPQEKTFTLEELSQFDGANGNPAYVAVDGTVYDVSDKPLWTGGTHNGNMAGQDLSDAILKSPHGKAKLKDLPIVGTLVK